MHIAWFPELSSLLRKVRRVQESTLKCVLANQISLTDTSFNPGAPECQTYRRGQAYVVGIIYFPDLTTKIGGDQCSPQVPKSP
jgi:hypothetical protein